VYRTAWAGPETVTIKVEGMSCPIVRSVSQAVKTIPGVDSVAVSLDDKTQWWCLMAKRQHQALEKAIAVQVITPARQDRQSPQMHGLRPRQRSPGRAVNKRSKRLAASRAPGSLQIGQVGCSKKAPVAATKNRTDFLTKSKAHLVRMHRMSFFFGLIALSGGGRDARGHGSC
jgi:copper chaperone CopZ